MSGLSYFVRDKFLDSTDKSINPELLDDSMSHKLNRILFQQHFKHTHQQQFELLTERELEVILLVVQGFFNSAIAEKLFISRHTVEQHRKNINRKLAIKSFTDIFQYALAFDLV